MAATPKGSGHARNVGRASGAKRNLHFPIIQFPEEDSDLGPRQVTQVIDDPLVLVQRPEAAVHTPIQIWHTLKNWSH